MTRTTMSVSSERKAQIERLAIEIQAATYKPFSWTDLVNYLIDNYAEKAKEEVIEDLTEPPGKVSRVSK